MYSCLWNSPRILHNAKSSFFVVTSSAHSLNSLFLIPMKSYGFIAERIKNRSFPWFSRNHLWWRPVPGFCWIILAPYLWLSSLISSTSFDFTFSSRYVLVSLLKTSLNRWLNLLLMGYWMTFTLGFAEASGTSMVIFVKAFSKRTLWVIALVFYAIVRIHLISGSSSFF